MTISRFCIELTRLTRRIVSGPAAVTPQDIGWADVAMIVEEEYRKRIRADFSSQCKPIHVLDIPDPYHFMDLELIDLIQSAAHRLQHLQNVNFFCRLVPHCA